MEEACRDHGITALHLEVERTNLRAAALYRRLGFRDHDRYLLTQLVGEAPSSAAERPPEIT
jgi:ribosomal protein S18 acetylase RimI-like enzyme